MSNTFEYKTGFATLTTQAQDDFLVRHPDLPAAIAKKFTRQHKAALRRMQEEIESEARLLLTEYARRHLKEGSDQEMVTEAMTNVLRRLRQEYGRSRGSRSNSLPQSDSPVFGSARVEGGVSPQTAETFGQVVGMGGRGSPQRGPVEAAIAAEEAQLLNESLGGLPPQQQEVLKLVAVEGWSYSRVADYLDITKAEVMRLYDEGRDVLRKAVRGF